jgi:hypothetical protein
VIVMVHNQIQIQTKMQRSPYQVAVWFEWRASCQPCCTLELHIQRGLLQSAPSDGVGSCPKCTVTCKAEQSSCQTDMHERLSLTKLLIKSHLPGPQVNLGLSSMVKRVQRKGVQSDWPTLAKVDFVEAKICKHLACHQKRQAAGC